MVEDVRRQIADCYRLIDEAYVASETARGDIARSKAIIAEARRVLDRINVQIAVLGTLNKALGSNAP
jgi:hypothetical protein